MSTNRINDELLKAVIELNKTLKNNRRPLAERNTKASRLGRGGEANATAIRSSGEDISALIDSLKDIHNSAKMGSAGLSTFFKTIKTAVNPLTDTFKKLDDVIDKISISGSKREVEAAKMLRDFIKANNGNIDAVKDITKTYSEYIAHLNDMVALQKSKKRDDQAINDALKKELELREELNKAGFKDILGSGMKKYFDYLKNNDKKIQSLGVDSLDKLKKEIDGMNKVFKTLNGVTTEFVKEIGDMQRKLGELFDNQIKSFGSNLIKAIQTDFARLPDIITSRLQGGFATNEYIDALRMGLSPEELNKFRSSNRDVLNAMGGFKPGSDLISAANMKDRTDELLKVGLIGKDASDYLTTAMRSAYRTGRTYDQDTAQRMLRDSMEIQQVFGGSIGEASAQLQDYTNQIYNIRRFNEAQTREQTVLLEQELKTRATLVKYLGYDIEYLKQQDQLRHNAQFGDIIDRIRGAVMGDVAANTYQQKFGWSDSDRELFSKARRPGVRLEGDEKTRYIELQKQIANDKLAYESQASRGGLDNYISTLGGNIVPEYFLARSGGETMEQITNAAIAADAEVRSRGEISPDDYTKFITASVDKQEKSINVFEQSVLEFKRAITGFAGMPGSALLGAVGGFALASVGKLLLKGRMKGALNNIFGKGTPKILGGAFGSGGFLKNAGSGISNLLSKIGLKGGNKAAAGAASSGGGKILGKFAGKTAGKSLVKKIPILGAAIGLGLGGSRLLDGDYLGAGLEGLSGVASTLPGLGTLGSLGLDALIGSRDVAKQTLPKSTNTKIDDSILGIGSLLMGPAGSLVQTHLINKYITPSIMSNVDKANNVKRDPNTGQIINESDDKSTKQISLLEKLVELLTIQNDLVDDGNTISKESLTQKEIAEHNRRSVAAHVENLSATLSDMFAVPAQ